MNDTATPTIRRSRAGMVAALTGEFRALPIAIALVALGAFFATQSDVFLTSRNISNLLVQSVVTGIVSLGIVFVLLVGEIDLSVAANSGVCSVLMSKLIVDSGWSPALAIVAAVVIGALIGAISGRWATWFGVPSFVVTLGVGLVLNGVQRRILPESGRYNLLNSGVEKIAGTNLSAGLGWLFMLIAVGVTVYLQLSTLRARRNAGVAAANAVRQAAMAIAATVVLGAIFVIVLNNDEGVPLPVIIFIGLVAIASYFTRETRFGLRLYAVGGNGEAASRVGVNIHRVKIAAFAVAGGLAAFGGVVAASRILGVSVTSGGGIGGGQLMLEAIAAAVIGGVSLFGGRGRVSAALLGAIVLGTVSNGLNLMGVNDDVKLIVTGLLLVVAVSLDHIIEKVTADGATPAA